MNEVSNRFISKTCGLLDQFIVKKEIENPFEPSDNGSKLSKASTWKGWVEAAEKSTIKEVNDHARVILQRLNISCPSDNAREVLLEHFYTKLYQRYNPGGTNEVFLGLMENVYGEIKKTMVETKLSNNDTNVPPPPQSQGGVANDLKFDDPSYDLSNTIPLKNMFEPEQPAAIPESPPRSRIDQFIDWVESSNGLKPTQCQTAQKTSSIFHSFAALLEHPILDNPAVRTGVAVCVGFIAFQITTLVAGRLLLYVPPLVAPYLSQSPLLTRVVTFIQTSPSWQPWFIPGNLKIILILEVARTTFPTSKCVDAVQTLCELVDLKNYVRVFGQRAIEILAVPIYNPTYQRIISAGKTPEEAKVIMQQSKVAKQLWLEAGVPQVPVNAIEQMD